MLHEKRYASRFILIGPGGWKCPCCAPAPRDRKRTLRAYKRGAYRRFLEQYVTEALDNA